MKRDNRINEAIKRGLVEDREDGIFMLTPKGRDVVEKMRLEEENKQLEEMNQALFQEALDALTASREAALDTELRMYLEHAASPSNYYN